MNGFKEEGLILLWESPFVRDRFQLEKLIDDAIKGSTFKRLEELQEESDEIISCNCSKQMTSKLNRLILRELNKKEIRNAGLLLSCIHKYGKHMTIEGEDGLAAMINEGLVQKINYNLQVAITESLCRMTSESQRQELANNWFHVEFVVDAFKRIKDSEFETVRTQILFISVAHKLKFD
ncbi:synaptonemal complex protein 2-like [Mobula hypostoma]|uniref:synaptonemal complex protein 2-like n=1 Tax=Mobula hypostoma TaxID=723540 RepID=UPI002FC28783